ncbi:MAG: ABC transporter ATP-binding protein, partial [Parasporobacterium sp.]|nr:ABC transporter ATP-binding protein [Parasporobacterium sp.]
MKALVPYSGSISASVLLALATVILTLRIPILTGQAVDCIVAAGSVDSVALFEVLKEMSITVVFTFFTQWAMNRINNRVTYSVTRELREAAFERMQRMPLSLVDGHGHGDYMSRIVADADAFSDGLLMGFTQAFTGIMTILGTIYFMIKISLPISLVVIVLTPLSLLVAKFVSSRSYRYFKEQAALKG